MAEQLADDVWDIVATWQALARDTVGQQIVRSADSIGANIAEGTGRGTALDNRRFVRMARGSLYETKHWLRRAYRRNLLNGEQVERLKQTVDELTRTLNGYLRALHKSSTKV
jgi:four helix bundle protein